MSEDTKKKIEELVLAISGCANGEDFKKIVDQAAGIYKSPVVAVALPGMSAFGIHIIVDPSATHGFIQFICRDDPRLKLNRNDCQCEKCIANRSPGNGTVN